LGSGWPVRCLALYQICDWLLDDNCWRGFLELRREAQSLLLFSDRLAPGAGPDVLVEDPSLPSRRKVRRDGVRIKRLDGGKFSSFPGADIEIRPGSRPRVAQSSMMPSCRYEIDTLDDERAVMSFGVLNEASRGTASSSLELIYVSWYSSGSYTAGKHEAANGAAGTSLGLEEASEDGTSRVGDTGVPGMHSNRRVLERPTCSRDAGVFTAGWSTVAGEAVLETGDELSQACGL
jgi:hypothetical protein